jgi:hypothetical protein
MNKLLNILAFFRVSIEVFFILVVLAIPTYFIWRWLFKKFIKVGKKRTMATWIATIIATPVIYAALILLWLFSMSYYPTHDFNKEDWLADKTKRYEYSENIIESKMLVGKTKIEIRQLLGDEGNKNDSDHWIYDLGFRPGFANMDLDILYIEFKNGRVIKVGHHGT